MRDKRFTYLVFTLFFIFTISTYSINFKMNRGNDIPKIKYRNISLNSVEDIEKYKESEDLYSFSNINFDLASLTPSKKKEVFVELLLPAIDVVNEEIIHTRNIIGTLSKKEFLTESEFEYAKKIFQKYKVPYGNWDKLQNRLLIYPTSLILSQGALESAWGTSRFFREGNNLFGIWSHNPNEPRIPARGVRQGGFVPRLKKYNSIKESVADIVLTLSRGSMYKKLRALIRENKSPEEIAQGLVAYSEEGEVYVRKVVNTLRKNNFKEYDID